MTVVVDCANGAASGVAAGVLGGLGASVLAIFDEPDGRNINDGCGALHPDVVAAQVVRHGADAGVAHDGDADRAVFADAQGNVIDGDQVLAASAVALHEEGRLAGDTVVTTVMANLGFHRAMAGAGIEVVTAKVGDRYVVEEMRRVGAVLGGEQSGHVIFADRAWTGDGLQTAIRFLSFARKRGLSVGGFAAVMHRFPQVIVNVKVADREALATSAPVQDAVEAAERALGDAGRVVVRASGTEPLVRVMVEAEVAATAQAHADAVAAAVRGALGAA
jgi:phosphoglucosamine mutase